MAFVLAILGVFFGFSNPLLYFPGLIILFPGTLVWLALRSQASFQTWKLAWMISSLAYAISLYWLVVPVHYYGGLPWVLSLPCPIIMGFYLGLYPSIFVLAVSWASKHFSWWLIGIFAGCLWTILEYGRGFLFSGFPWLSLPQALASWPIAIQVVKFIGAFAYSGLIVLMTTWLVLSWRRKRRLVLPIIIFLALLLLGFQQTQKGTEQGEKISLSIIQGNIDQNMKWDQKYQEETLEKYLQLSLAEVQTNKPKLIVWPETAMPFYLQDDIQLKTKISRFVQQNNLLLLTGAPGYSYDHSKQAQYFNRAYLFKNGQVIDIYEKEHLVPFGEYVPDFLPFLNKLVPSMSDFSPGIKTSPLKSNDLAIGTLICYEIIFPGLVQKRIDSGANLLVNMSNDAWFGKTSAPKQHFHQAILRAVEQNRYIVRATNTGISGLIDPCGFVRKKSSLFQEASLNYPQVMLIQERTFFSKHHQEIFWLVIFLSGILIFKAWWQTKK